VFCDSRCGLSDFKCERDEPAVSDLVLGQPELLASGADEDGVAVSDQIPESPDHGERERVERHDVHLGASAAENLICAGGDARHRGTREREEQDPIVGFAFCYSFKMGVSCGERAGRLSDTRSAEHDSEFGLRRYDSLLLRVLRGECHGRSGMSMRPSVSPQTASIADRAIGGCRVSA
jgi:hypothetical protein